MDLNKLQEGIAKTGFMLEFDISSILTSHGWTIINNKYYIDDQQESVREIDLVAYKARLVQHFYVYTTLIISCKKNEKDSWILFAKDRNRKDPNINWQPVHAWSNDKAITYMLKNQSWRRKYLNKAKAAGCMSIADPPKKHIFAFQEMNKVSGSPNNDKNIFNSIVSLMKAQAYEMNALPYRKKQPAAFQFNLISVVDTELVRSDFSKKKIVHNIVEDEIYVAGYIINKEQTFAKIHLINADAFEEKLNEYDDLHEANVDFFDSIFEDFFVDAIKVSAKHDVYIEEFKKEVWSPIFIKMRKAFDKGFDRKSLWLYWSDSKETLQILLDLEEYEITALNEDEKLHSRIATALKNHYRYTGPFEFSTDDIPF